MMNRLYILLICITMLHTATAQQYQLDSVVRTMNDQQLVAIQKNDIEERQAEVVRLGRKSNFSDIEYREKTQLSYDLQGNYLQSISQLWNGDNSNWVDASKAEWKYNDKEELTWTASYRKQGDEWLAEDQYERIISQDTIVEVDFRYENNILAPIRKHFSLKNEAGEVYHYETMMWNDAIGDWEKSYVSKTFFVNDTIPIGRENYFWDENHWQGKDKEEYELDQNNQKTENFTLYQGDSMGNWVSRSRFEEIKLPEQNTVLNNTYSWSVDDQDWLLHSRVEIFRHEEDHIQNMRLLEFDEDSDQLLVRGELMHLYNQYGQVEVIQDISHRYGTVNGTQHCIKYDEDGNILREDHYEFDAENNTWKGLRSTEFFYDKNVVLSTSKGQDVMDFFLLCEHQYASKKYAVKSVKTYEVEDGKRTLTAEYNYFYSQKL